MLLYGLRCEKRMYHTVPTCDEDVAMINRDLLMCGYFVVTSLWAHCRRCKQRGRRNFRSSSSGSL